MYKNLRFSLISLLMMLCGTMFAEEVTFTASEISGAATGAIAVHGVTFEAAKNSGSTVPQFNTYGQDFRIYAKGTLSVSTNGTITKMVFNISSQGLKRLAPITASTGSIAAQASGDTIVVWTGESNEVVLTVGDKAEYGSDGSDKAGQFDFSSVTITYDYDGIIMERVATPVITPDGGEFEESIEVTISCATEGATIKYCLENEWIDYTGPLTLTESAAVGAYAVCDGMEDSETVHAQFTKKEQQEIPTALLDFTSNTWGLPEGNDNKTVDRKTYSNGTYEIILEGSTGNGYYYNTNGFLILGKKDASLTLPAFDFDVEKIVVTGASGASTAVKQNIFVGEDSVSTETTGAKNANEYIISEYNQYAGTNYTLKVTSAHNTQITKIAVYKKDEGGEVGEKVAAPVITPNGGEFEESVEVTISCATEGATIKYCLENEWIEYTGPLTLTESTTLAAYAVCEGMKDSETVRAQFTKKEQENPSSQEITFDFNKDYKTLFPTITGESSGSGESYVSAGDITEEVTATVGDVSVTVSPAAEGTTTPNRIWSSNPRLRMYSGTLTFTSTGDNITKIVFTQSTTKKNGAFISDGNTAEPGDLTKTNQQNNGTVTWTGNAESVIITIAGNTQYSKAVVTIGEAKEQVPAPVFTPNGGEFEDSVDVTLSCSNESAFILYAVASDTEPDWQLYSEPIRLKESTELMAYAACDGIEDSEIVRATFTKKEVETVIDATIAEFNAAEESTSVWYKLTGTISNLKAGDQYGNFDIEDETGSVYVYGLLSEKGGNKKQFQQLVADKFLQNGSKLTLIGNRGSYNEKIEVLNAYFVSVDNSGIVEAPAVVCDSIGAFIAMEDGSEAVLKFGADYNVQVVFSHKAENGNDWVIIQDNRKDRVVLYNTGLAETLNDGDVLSDSIVGALSLYYGMNELIKTANTNTASVKATAGTPVKADALADVAHAWDPFKILKLCKVSKVTCISENNRIFATDDSEKALEIRDNFKVGYTLPELAEGQTLNITGIVVPFIAKNSTDTVYQISPISQEAIEVVYPPYYKEFAETEVLLTTVANIQAESADPAKKWIEGGETQATKKGTINPVNDEEGSGIVTEGVLLKKGNGSKMLKTLVTGVEALWAYGCTAGSSDRDLVVTVTDEAGEAVTARGTSSNYTSVVVKVSGLDKTKKYTVEYTGTNAGQDSGADVVIHGVKFFPEAPVEVVVGDVNGDGSVGIGDIVTITNVMAGIETDEAIKAAADVNGDGDVGIGDIVAITNIMAGI